MSTRLDVEDVQTTKGEKLLAVVLAIFLLIGGVWTYVKIDDAVRRSTPAGCASSMSSRSARTSAARSLPPQSRCRRRRGRRSPGP